MKFINEHSWIIPVVAAFLTVGTGWFIGWLLTRGDSGSNWIGNFNILRKILKISNNG